MISRAWSVSPSRQLWGQQRHQNGGQRRQCRQNGGQCRQISGQRLKYGGQCRQNGGQCRQNGDEILTWRTTWKHLNICNIKHLFMNERGLSLK